MKSLIFVIALSSLGFCYGNPVPPCEPLYPDCPRCNNVTLPLTKVGEKYYYFELNAKANWYSASQFCHFHGIHLANIENEKENLALSAYVKGTGFPEMKRIWTSGTDLSEQSNWFWFSLGKRVTYFNWRPGQPDNAGGIEHCLEFQLMSGVFGWNDLPCVHEHPFICEVQSYLF